ncbi:MAG: PIN domain-containing protein [Nitrospirota bacterium]
MRDRIFLDSNILIYSSLQDDKGKHNETLNFLEKLKGKIVFISTQVINEVYVALLKHELEDEDIQNIVLKIIDIYNSSIITVDTIKKSWNLRRIYNLSYWDSLIVASALESRCEVLYTEDMQDDLVINNTLTVKNPFL